MRKATYDPASVQVTITLPVTELSPRLAKAAQRHPLGGWAAEGLKKSTHAPKEKHFLKGGPA